MLPSFSWVKKRKRHDEFYDPDYERMHSSPLKKLYVDGKINQENVATNLIGNIKSISPRITLLFQNEVLMKREQLTELDKKLDCARALIDRLRFGVVDKYYDKHDLIISETESSTVRGKASLFEVEVSESQIKMHPAVKYLIRKRPKETEIIGKLIPELPAAHNANNTTSSWSELQKRRERPLQQVIREHGLVIDNSETEGQHFALTSAAILPTKMSRTNTTVCKSGSHSTITHSIVNEGTFERATKPLNISRLNNKTKHMIVIGNTSRYIGQDNDNGEGQIPLGGNNLTHKWLVYVQSKDSKFIQSFIKKVRFNLDSSYRPNDVVDIQEPPFQISRRGWGEFPIRIQLYFHEHLKQKPIQIIHNLVLDRTLSGMHTLGAETLMEIWLRTNGGIEQCLFHNNSNLKVLGDINNKEETKCKSPSNDTTTATSSKGKKDLDDNLSNQIKSNIEPKEPILSKYRNDPDSVTPKECHSVITQNYRGMLPEQKEKSIENNSVSSPKFLKPVFEKRALAKPISLKDEEIEDIINKSKSVLITSHEAKKFTTTINSYSKKSNTNNIIALRRVVNLVPLKGTNMTTPDVKYSSATKDIFQKKLVQFKNTRSEIKATQVLVGIANNLPVTEVGSLNSTKVTVQSSVPKTSVKYITSSSVNLPQNDSYKDENKTMIWTQSLVSYTKRNISELTSNTIDSPKQIVFQKEGKLFIIDPLQIKLKQERKKQISLLKPQTYSKHQHQQQSHYKSAKSKALQCMMSDHDYTPSVANSTLNKSTTSARKNSGSIKSFDDELQPKVLEANFGVEQPLVEKGTDSELLQQLQIQFEQEFVARNVGVRYVVDYALHHLPLIAPESILASSFSFSSQSLMDFDVLPIMKQRACEWLRAKYVKHFLRKNKYLKDLPWTNKEVSWSTREVLVYARYHGFTPKMKLFEVSCSFQPQTQNSTSKAIPIHPSNPEQPNNTKVNNDFEQRHKLSQYLRRRVKLDRNYFRFESLTPYSRITSWLFAAYRKLNIDKRSSAFDSEPIDIVNIPTNAFRETLNCKTINTHIKQLRCMRISEHLSESSMLVNDFVRALRIKLEPEIVEMDETFPLVHTVIAQCLNLFVEKLIRHTVALKTNTSVVDSLNITKQDIGNILVRYADFDFLTTKYFGKYEYDLKKCEVEM